MTDYDEHAVSFVELALARCGLADRPGRLLYSGLGTLRPGSLYLVGLNPGGDPILEPDSPAQHLNMLRQRAPDWNEYIDGVWYPGGRRMAPGQAPMQRRVRALLEGVGFPVRSVCAANMIFLRAASERDLGDAERLARQCWPVHREILRIVRPSAMICLGNRAFDLAAASGAAVLKRQSFPSGHGDWQCQSVTMTLEDRRIRLIGLPHLSRYAVDAHPDVMRWVKDQIDPV